MRPKFNIQILIVFSVYFQWCCRGKFSNNQELLWLVIVSLFLVTLVCDASHSLGLRG